jgi:Uma2 family endonuclease
MSGSTRRIDRALKLAVYAREGVRYVWLVEPLDRSLKVFELRQGSCTLLATFCEDDPVRAVPFDAIEFDLALLWADVEPTPAPLAPPGS